MTDREIIRLYREGNNPERAFDHLLEKYEKRLYWHIRRILLSHEDTDDVLQNVLIKVWNGLENFRGEAQIYTWLYRIATNEALSFLKKNKDQESSLEDHAKIACSLESDEYFDGDDLQRSLQEAIALLPDKQRIVFTMRYFDRTPYKDLAKILKTSAGALKASYHHAEKKVEHYLKERY